MTTHFMNEGMRCDRISLMNAGKVLACDAPQKLIEARGAASLEDAFIGYMEDAIADAAPQRRKQGQGARQPHPRPAQPAAPPAPSKHVARPAAALAGCSPTRATRPCRSFAIRFDWPSPSSARRC